MSSEPLVAGGEKKKKVKAVAKAKAWFSRIKSKRAAKKSQPKIQEDEYQWLVEAVLQFVQSPLWTVPLSEFIDAKCLVFTMEEENKFEYTVIHNDYKQLIEDLLLVHLIDWGLDLETFFAACKANKSPGVDSMVQGLLVADDFLAFKTRMVTRNLTLEAEALAALQEAEARGESLHDGSSMDCAQIQASQNSFAQSAMMEGMNSEEALAAAIAASLEQSKEEEQQQSQSSSFGFTNNGPPPDYASASTSVPDTQESVRHAIPTTMPTMYPPGQEQPLVDIQPDQAAIKMAAAACDETDELPSNRGAFIATDNDPSQAFAAPAPASSPPPQSPSQSPSPSHPTSDGASSLNPPSTVPTDNLVPVNDAHVPSSSDSQPSAPAADALTSTASSQQASLVPDQKQQQLPSNPFQSSLAPLVPGQFNPQQQPQTPSIAPPMVSTNPFATPAPATTSTSAPVSMQSSSSTETSVATSSMPPLPAATSKAPTPSSGGSILPPLAPLPSSAAASSPATAGSSQPLAAPFSSSASTSGSVQEKSNQQMMEERAAHLRRQRDILLARKSAERAAALKEYQEYLKSQGGQAPPTQAPPQSGAASTASSSKPSPAPAPNNEAAARQALVASLTADLFRSK